MPPVRLLECRGFGATPDLHVALRERPATPGPSQVLVDVHATSVNPIDVKRSSGYGRRLLALKGAALPPLVLGNDFAGVVRAVGAKVRDFEPGQPVYGLLPTGRGGGAHASTVLIDAKWLRSAPGRCSREHLAALPYTFTTMTLAVRGAGLDQRSAKGKRVLVNGGGGGLGRLALQLLRSWDARATAVCSARDMRDCMALGAEEVVDRRAHTLRSLPPTFDAALNFGNWEDDAVLVSRLGRSAVGHATTVHPLLDHFDRRGWAGGLTASFHDFSQQRRRLAGNSPAARYRWVVFKPDGAALDQLQSLLDAGAEGLPVGTSIPLERALEAFNHVSERRPGRALLLP